MPLLPARNDALTPPILAGEFLLGVIGLGHVGVPLARAAVNSGIRVLGFDIDPVKVERFNAILAQFDADFSAVEGRFSAEHWQATTDLEQLGRPDAFVICVPTPLNPSRAPDLGPIQAAAAAIAGTLRSGQLIVLASTTYPGCTREILLPALESRNGLILQR